MHNSKLIIFVLVGYNIATLFLLKQYYELKIQFEIYKIEKGSLKPVVEVIEIIDKSQNFDQGVDQGVPILSIIGSCILLGLTVYWGHTIVVQAQQTLANRVYDAMNAIVIIMAASQSRSRSGSVPDVSTEIAGVIADVSPEIILTSGVIPDVSTEIILTSGVILDATPEIILTSGVVEEAGSSLVEVMTDYASMGL